MRGGGGGGWVNFAKILLTSYVNAPYKIEYYYSEKPFNAVVQTPTSTNDQGVKCSGIK